MPLFDVIREAGFPRILDAAGKTSGPGFICEFAPERRYGVAGFVVKQSFTNYEFIPIMKPMTNSMRTKEKAGKIKDIKRHNQGPPPPPPPKPGNRLLKTKKSVISQRVGKHISHHCGRSEATRAFSLGTVRDGFAARLLAMTSPIETMVDDTRRKGADHG